MQKEVLEIRRRILGEEHPHTISAMSSLANTLNEQGQLKEAAAMMKEVLEKRNQILGEQHPHTISAMNNLANKLDDQGQLEEAAAMQKEVLEKRRRILGEEHPDTISAINNLANTLSDQGQRTEAAAMRKEVLEMRSKILGEEHPSTIMAMSNLALTLGGQGQPEEATAMQKEVLKKRRRILGEEHPDTISAINNLASTLSDQKQFEEAAAMQKEVLEKRRRILGEEHPDTTTAMISPVATLYNLGALYYDLENFDKQEENYRSALRRCEIAHGPEHTLTLTIVHTLSQLYRDCGKLVKMIQLVSIWGGWIVGLFGDLGRALLQIPDDSNARNAFQQQIQVQNNVLVFANIQFDGCGLAIPFVKKRFVCRQCEDVDLCVECWDMHRIHTREVATCADHTFLEVALDTRPSSDQASSIEEQDQASWLQELYMKYRDQIP